MKQTALSTADLLADVVCRAKDVAAFYATGQRRRINKAERELRKAVMVLADRADFHELTSDDIDAICNS